MPKYTYYDLGGMGTAPWSVNLVPTRLAMNHKGVEYESVFLRMDDIDSALREHGQADADTVRVPVLKVEHDDGRSPEYIIESVVIAKYIEQHHPSPPLFTGAAGGEEAQDGFVDYVRSNITRALFPWLCADIPEAWDASSQGAKDYFQRTRKAMFKVDDLREISGYETDAVPRAGTKGAECLEKLRLALAPIGHRLRQSDGEYLFGKQKTYADMMLFGPLYMCERINKTKLPVILDLDAEGNLRKWYERMHAECGKMD